MLIKADIKRMLGDLMRTELARRKVDALAVFESDDIDEVFVRMPQDLLQNVFTRAAAVFGFEPRTFSGLDLMTDFAFASYIQTGGVTFLTSGSTGMPKKCFHSDSMIREEAYGLKFLFPNIRRVVSLVPSSHLYGFSFTVTLPRALNVPVINLAALPTQPWEKLLQEGDLVAGFPLFWNYWLRCGNRFPQGIYTLSSTSPCKDETIQGLLDAGTAGFTEIYGASETGAIAHRHAPAVPFEILPFWETLNDPTPQIRRIAGGDWKRLPDQVELTGERFLIPLKRTDECVQVAGINVYPKRVEAVLSAHPAVKECRVRLMRPEEGNRLKAFIVLNEGYSQEHLGIIRTYLGQKLTVHELPRTFTFGDHLPASHLGKDADW